MPTTTFPEPPPPFACGICRTASYASKLGTPECRACPAHRDRHFFPRPIGDTNCDVLFIGDTPLVPRLTVLRQDREPEHVTFNDTAGRVVLAAVAQLKKDVRFANLRCHYTYAVKCAVDSATKKMLTACKTPLVSEIGKIAHARANAGNKSPLIVVAHGVTALRSLGISVASETEAMGMTYTAVVGEVPVTVVASRGMKSIVGAPGKFSSLVADIERAFQIAIDKPVARIDRDTLEQHYRYPKTIAEVKALCDEIIAFAPPGQDPAEWAISVDTETNTLFPHRDGLQLTIVSIAWAPGRACAIPLWHKDTPYDPAEAWEHVKRVLLCPKKKIFHNAKYDLKVFWKMKADVERLYWDVMLAEHALEEDKKGQYGLKYLVKQFLPTYAGYEDQLHEKLAAAQGERQLDNARKTRKAEENSVEVPPAAAKALEEAGLKTTFQPSRLKAKVDELKARLATYPTPVDLAIAALDVPLPAKGKKYQKRMTDLKAQAEGIINRSELIPPTDEEQLFLDRVGILLTASEEGALPSPPTEEDAKFVAAAEVVLAYASYFKGAASKEATTKRELKSGGFENIPLWDTIEVPNPEDETKPLRATNYARGVQLFYAAVDADVTRQLAIQQHKRMAQEDEAFRAMKKEVRGLIDMERRRGATAFEVKDLCTIPNPVVNLVKSYYVPRVRELADMEFRGVRVNHEYIRKSMGKLEGVVREETEKLYRMAGTEFKVGDGRKIARYLFETGEGYIPTDKVHAAEIAQKHPDRVYWDGERIRFKGVSYTEKGALQTTEKVLRTLANSYGCEFSNTVLLLRKATKAKDTFLYNALELSKDGYIHTNYNPNGTATGRLSSNDINMQNIPKGEMGGIPKSDPRYMHLTADQRSGVSCKKMFTTDDDSFLFVNADAKGAEVSVFAAYSMDAKLIAALRDGMDAHSFFSSQILNPDKVAFGLSGAERKRALEKVGVDDEHAWSYEDFFNRDAYAESDDPALKDYGKRLKKHRDNVKRVVFGILFGAGPKKIAEIVGIEEALARAIIDLLFKMFPTIPAFIEQTKWELRTFGMVETYFGRKRRFAMKNAPKEMMARAERQAVNFKIQASNSDIVLWCLTEMAPVIRNDFGGRMLLTVHDSLGFQVKKQYVTQLKDFMAEYGTRRVAKLCPWFPVDFKWDIEVGPSYGELMSVDKYVSSHREELESLSQPLVEEEILDDLRMEGEGELN
jgi:DNA polymerase I-like protein with 3'-5' exonuclease and polymerase domains/uracil-DNA glycosylase